MRFIVPAALLAALLAAASAARDAPSLPETDEAGLVRVTAANFSQIVRRTAAHVHWIVLFSTHDVRHGCGICGYGAGRTHGRMHGRVTSG